MITKISSFILTILLVIPIFSVGFFTYLFIATNLGESEIKQNPYYILSMLIFPALATIIGKLTRINILYRAGLFALIWSGILVVVAFMMAGSSFIM